MKRKQIAKAVEDFRASRGSLVDFTIQQVNAALEEAAALIDGVGTLEHNDAEKIRALKVKP